MDEKFRKKTDDLINELCGKNVDFNEYIANNENSLIEMNLSEFWKGLVEKSKMKNSDIINKSGISYYYYYEILNGKKVPSRGKIVTLILAMHLSLEDCQKAMKYCGKSALYPKVKKDSAFIFAITHNLTVSETEELLLKEGLGKINE